MSASKTKELLIQELYDRGAHFGYSRTRRHPSIVPFLYGMKNRIDLIDLETTTEQIEKARTFISSIANSKKKILIVGTKAEARESVRKLAEQQNLPYVAERWIGGTLTNWSEIKGRIDTLEQLRTGLEKGTLVYKTKKERLMIEREIENLEKKFGGLSGLDAIPGAVIIIDPRAERIAVDECLVRQIPVIALANTDCDISHIGHPIIGNDASVQTIHYVLEYLLDVINSVEEV